MDVPKRSRRKSTRNFADLVKINSSPDNSRVEKIEEHSVYTHDSFGKVAGVSPHNDSCSLVALELGLVESEEDDDVKSPMFSPVQQIEDEAEKADEVKELLFVKSVPFELAEFNTQDATLGPIPAVPLRSKPYKRLEVKFNPERDALLKAAIDYL